MMNKSLRGPDAESSDKRGYGFRRFLLGIQPAPKRARRALACCLSMILSENRFTLFQIMLTQKSKKEPPEDRRL
ncbi:hypothetical protein IVA80_07275 [Bradyrhizobium sp. 139]|uniref:hypothetical protein n=1 Tax=Bradyrhizobium sp. 139 TaxID=2782616 RepID=UPI001FFB626F|nr:hypothetical protein [Bradyrhizobium sp. 139]MCK1740677.1 hypothetical protein [Bradyrhizobium sp. 139]